MSAFKDWLNGLTSKTTPVDADELYVRDSSGRAVLVAWSRWLPGSVNAVAPSRRSSASPTGLLLSATVPGVATGVVPVESCH